jgi:hypothetical protein
MTPGIESPSSRPPHQPPDLLARGRKSRSLAAASPRGALPVMAACWSSPRRVTCRLAGPAVRALENSARPTEGVVIDL